MFILAQDDGVVDVEIKGDVEVHHTEHQDTAVEIVSKNGDVTFTAEDVKATVKQSEDTEGYYPSTGIDVYTEGWNSTVNVKVEDVKADYGVQVDNNGGIVKVETEDVKATREGVEVSNDTTSDEKTEIEEKEYNAVQSAFSDEERTYYQGDGSVVKYISLPDGTRYDIYYDADGKFVNAYKSTAKGEPGKTTVTVKGNVDVEGEFASTGLNLSADVKRGDIDASVTRNVIVKQSSDGKNTPMSRV